MESGCDCDVGIGRMGRSLPPIWPSGLVLGLR